ncbi:MAG: tetratricopeptide repeat protein [Rhodospirillales bacterium]|nr:tetratricopeptide repeat protein [Rhodospirillales bacterium]
MPDVNEAVARLKAGLARHAAGDTAGALALFEGAARDAPGLADAHYLTGAVLSQMGRDGEALAPLERALALSPATAAYHGAHALALKGAGREAEALAAFARQVALAPGDADAHFNYANALAPADSAAAERGWRTALELNPGHAGAAVNLGNLLARRGDWEGALAAFARAPDVPAALVGAAAALIERGDGAAAEAKARRATQLAPADTAAWRNLGIALAALGRFDEALAAYGHAGGDVDTRVAAAAARCGMHDHAAAAAQLAELAREAPRNFEAWLNLGVAEAGRGRYAAARAAFATALDIRPGSAKALANLANAELYCGDAAAARPLYAAARAAAPDDPATASTMLYALNYDDTIGAAEIVAAHRRWGAGLAQRPRPARRGDGGRLRVGLVSGDFCHHSCAFVLAAVLPHFERERVSLHAYSNTAREDAMTARLKPHFDGWRPIVGHADADVAEQVAADGIDVLVDLSGHTRANRMGLFALRPAHVQATWLGYPATTGQAAIDMRIVDAVTDPDDASCVERAVRVNGGFLAFQPPPAPEPSRADGPPTFGSFNNVAKLGPRTVALWSRVLQAVPDARLLLKALSFEDPGIVARYRALFAANGIEPARIDLVGWVAGSGGHLGLYSRVDVALDPFPYNGTITTLEALWMGVPVVTLAGDRHAARVGASILTHAGRADLIAADEADYVARAVAALRAAEDRAALRARLGASPLMDGKRLARELTRAWTQALRDVP